MMLTLQAKRNGRWVGVCQYSDNEGGKAAIDKHFADVSKNGEWRIIKQESNPERVIDCGGRVAHYRRTVGMRQVIVSPG